MYLQLCTNFRGVECYFPFFLYFKAMHTFFIFFTCCTVSPFLAFLLANLDIGSARCKSEVFDIRIFTSSSSLIYSNSDINDRNKVT